LGGGATTSSSSQAGVVPAAAVSLDSNATGAGGVSPAGISFAVMCSAHSWCPSIPLPNANSSTGGATAADSMGALGGSDTAQTASNASTASRASISLGTGLADTKAGSISVDGIDGGATGVGTFAAGAVAPLRKMSFPGATGATNGAAVGRWAIAGRMNGRLGAEEPAGPPNGRAPRRAKGVVLSSFF
jgi:hypothetical protein